MLLVKDSNISERVEGIDEQSKEFLEVVCQAINLRAVCPQLRIQVVWNTSCFEALLNDLLCYLHFH